MPLLIDGRGWAARGKAARKEMKIFGLAGWSGSGKTTLATRLIPALIARGVSVSTIKHAHHSFDVDQPGKDSYEHRQAGATEVVVTSGHRWALMHELRGAGEPTIAELARRMSPVDLLLVEGYKREAHAKLEVFRPACRQPPLCREDPHIVAVASDEPQCAALSGVDLPRLHLDDIDAIADFIIAQCGLGPAARGVG